MLNSIFSNFNSSIELRALLLCVMCSIFLGFIISLTYKFTSKYSKNFLLTLFLLPLFVHAIIIMVNGNLGTSVAVLGAFSLIKYRSAPGNSKEILFVLFAMTIGLACGMGHLFFATIITLIGCASILIANRVSIFDLNPNEMILKIVIPEDLDYTDIFNDTLSKYTDSYQLINIKTTNMGSLYDLKYRLKLKSNCNTKEFIDELRIKNGNLKIVLSQPIDDNEF